MSLFNALRGTLMGRKVKTEKQVLEEMADCTDETAADVTIAPSASLENASAGSTDLFSFEKLVEHPEGGFELVNLEVREGTWSSLWLKDKLFADGAKLDPIEFSMLCNGVGIVENGIFIPSPRKPAPETLVMPSKPLYWFMRAGYELNGSLVSTNLKSFLKALPGNPVRINAERIESEQHSGDTYLTITTNGWPKDHPLYSTKEFKSDKIPPVTYIEPQSPSRELIYHLTSDPDMDRVGSVLRWLSGAKIQLPFLLSPDHQTQTTSSPVAFRSDSGSIDASFGISGKFQAYSLFAPKDKFKPRGGMQ